MREHYLRGWRVFYAPDDFPRLDQHDVVVKFQAFAGYPVITYTVPRHIWEPLVEAAHRTGIRIGLEAGALEDELRRLGPGSIDDPSPEDR